MTTRFAVIMLRIVGRQVALLFAIVALVVAVSPKRSQAAKCARLCVMKYANKDCKNGKCVYWDTDTCFGCDPATGKHECMDTTFDKSKPNCRVETGKINGTYYPICTEVCKCGAANLWVQADMFNGSPTDGPTFDRMICK
ncbi:MAG: hypothetical protein K2W96_14735 [Gemmataceae bacterium]|nr:hypothetical protein [Gemmataceae bacterium]